MAVDVNDRYKGTKSQFIRKAGILSAYIVTLLDNNQNIKRYLYYDTQNPLGENGLEKDGDIIPQPNIEKSLIDDYIFDSLFNEDMEDTHRSQIYVHTHRGDVDGEFGDVLITVNILVPLTILHLSNFGEKRTFCIGNEVENMFQNKYIGKNPRLGYLVDELGNLRWKVIKFENTRLSKTNNIAVLTLVLRTNISTLRIDE